MERLKAWLNKQIANTLRDLQECPRQDPIEDPSPARACCRLLFVVSLLLGFLFLLVYNFVDAPDARVVQVHNLTPGAKNHAFPSCFLYDRNSRNCKKWPRAEFPQGISASCPCTNTSVPWRNFVNFFTLHNNSTVWNMGFSSYSLRNENPNITVPDDTVPLEKTSIVEDPQRLTAERFCDLSYLWPIAQNDPADPDLLHYGGQNVSGYLVLRDHCVWMATLMFTGSNPDYEDRTRSTQNLSTPYLFSRKELNTNLAQLARDSVLARRLALDMVLSLSAGNEGFRRFFNALARSLRGLLDREEMDPRQSYVYGARDLSNTLRGNQFYDSNAIVWYLGDNLSPIFLHPQIDWEAYHEDCFPEYCEVIKPMRGVRKLYWAIGILGGVATIILAGVTKLLWPCTAMLLQWICKCNAERRRAPGPLLHDIGL